MAKAQEEMLNIPDHKRNENQNHNKIPPPSCYNDYQEHKQQILARMWGKKEPHTLLVGM
jgi:hypothetical protein